MKPGEIDTRRTEQNTVCFSGHRKLCPAEIPVIRQRLRQVIRESYMNGYRWFICGGALGFDTLAALEVLAAKAEYPDIRLYLAIPCDDQDARWPERDRKIYREIMLAADETMVLSPCYFTGCMHLRNQFMVHHASVCICWLKNFSGGTGYTVRYAISCNRCIINLCMKDSSGMIKEPSWNSTYIFPSVSANALTAHSIPLPVAAGKKWKNMYLRFSGKRVSGNRS